MARRTGLTDQSISRIVGGLVARGLCEFGEPLPSAGKGPAALSVHLKADALYTVGISLMTDAVSVMLMNFAGEALRIDVIRPDDMSRPTVLEAVITWVSHCCNQLNLDRGRLLGAGVAITGYFIGEGSQVNPPRGLDDWALIDISELFGRALGLPIWVDNDGNAAAVGEQMNGAGRWANSFAYLYFAAGFGGGLIADGQPFRGAHGNAGEFASVLPADWVSPTLERLRSLMAEGGRRYASLTDMVEHFQLSAPGVEQWLHEAARAISLVVSAISAISDPDAIVLGGRLPKALGEQLIPRLVFQNPPRRMRPRPMPSIVCAEASGDASVTGAATLPLKALFFS
ncbi:MAG: ROK family protein [Pseudomonadota bacterium]|nr:ROK family protein [Pseudomonadota bacterium]